MDHSSVLYDKACLRFFLVAFYIGKYSINGYHYKVGSTFAVAQEGSNQISFYSVDTAVNKEKNI
jgi:hypothetical protein